MRYYLDCEFNGFGGQLISMALVSERATGREVYLANPSFSPEALKESELDHYVDPWVRENVLPIITVEGVCAPLWAPIQHWPAYLATLLLGDRDPVIVTDWPDDVRYFCQSVITGPGQMIAVPSLRFEVRRVDAYPSDLSECVQHNAYCDAMALRHKLQGGASLSPAQQAHVEQGWPL